jgi:protoheme IX farnesyltransferase
VYTAALWVTSVVLAPVAGMGLLYTVPAVVLGGAFFFQALELRRTGTPAQAMRLFNYSISYLTLLFAAMAVDQLVRR